MNETIKLGIVLLIITALAGGILAGVNSMTAPVIAEREKLESFGALLEIFPDANDFVPIEDSLLDQIKSANGNVTEVLEATEDGNVVGYAFKVASGGFHGDIVFQLGLYSSGTVAGLKVMQHGETPGFGADITDKPEYAESFPGKNFTQGL
ncbi:MAG: FMN-binding protein, partial [Gudongella sp.]|nr:FMN-binding protein [Gudongella sp.]